MFYLREITDSDTGYAVLLGAWSVGAVLGSLLGGNRRFGARSSLPILLGGGLVGAAILIEGLWASAVGLAVVFLAGGLGNGCTTSVCALPSTSMCRKAAMALPGPSCGCSSTSWLPWAT